MMSPVRFLLLWGCALALSLVACQEAERKNGAGGSAARGKVKDFYSCKSSSDCVIERQKDCCPCNAGGREVAIRKDAVAAYRSARTARCQGSLMCPQIYLCDDSAVTFCQAGRCTLGVGKGVPRGASP